MGNAFIAIQSNNYGLEIESRNFSPRTNAVLAKLLSTKVCQGIPIGDMLFIAYMDSTLEEYDSELPNQQKEIAVYLLKKGWARRVEMVYSCEL